MNNKMQFISIFLFTIYQSIWCKRSLQQAYVAGFYGQQCLPPASDFMCQRLGMIVTDQQSGTLQCGIDYACCLCQSVVCGSQAQWCDTFQAGGESSVWGVQDIRVYGEPQSSGAVVTCGAPNACAGAQITGSWIDTIGCAGDGACKSISVDVTNSRGLNCDKEACVNGNFKLTSNLGGNINCGSEKACVGATIEVSGIEFVKCNGEQSCQRAKITVIDPIQLFHLDCNGDLSCNDLELTVIISEPIGGCADAMYGYDVTEWKGITCGTGGSCEGLKLTVINNGCKAIRLEDLQCNAGRACTGAVFDFNAGNGFFPVDIANCMCGPSCLFATGIDVCYNNVHTMECLGPDSCSAVDRQIFNVANDFLLLCIGDNSCTGMKLTLSLSSASQNLIQRIDGFDCGGIDSCKNAVINIINGQIGSNGARVSVSIGDIICTKPGACQDTTFVIGTNVGIQRVICIPGACDGCVIKENANSVGVPCTDGSVAPIVSETTLSPIQLIPPEPPIIQAIPPQTPNVQPPFLPIDPAPAVPAIPAVPAVPSVPVPYVPIDPIVPAVPTPTEPVPAEPLPLIPVDPVPAEPVPAEPIPAEPIPTEPVPAVPVDPAPVEPLPAPELPLAPVPEVPSNPALEIPPMF